MDWDKLKSFYEIAISRSISKASAKLNISQSALSRQIQDLEYDLKTPLFIRHQKGVRLTEQGENLFNTVNQINFSISDFEKKLLDKKTKPVGKLTVSTTVGFGSAWLTPRITKFVNQYPEIDVNLIMSDEEVDLSARVADVGAGLPSPVSNIDWILKIGKEGTKRRPKFRVNSIYAMSLAIEKGGGLASLPDYMVADKPQLVRVLPNLEGPSYQTYFVYSESFKNDRRLEVFRDFLFNEAKDWHY